MLQNVVIFYISIRTLLLAFYNVYPLPGVRITDLVGFLFPVVLIVLFSVQSFNNTKYSKSQKVYFFVICFVTISILFKVLFYEINILQVAKNYMKIITGFLIFTLFPRIFTTEKDVKKLLTAFLISTIFPALQIFGQYFFGQGFLGLKTEIISDDVQMYIGVYGNHGVFGLISWIGPLCLITMVYFKKMKKIVIGLLFVGFIAIGIMTLSRTILILMLVVIIGIFSILLKRKNIVLMAVFTATLLVYILFTPMFKQSYRGLVVRSTYEIEVLRGEREIRMGLHGRVSRWENNLTSFFSNYSFEEQLIGTDLQIGPHGDYVTWLIGFGWFGLLLYAYLIGGLLYRTWRLRRWTIDPFLKHFGTTVILGLIIWIIMAISTNPSLMPDFAYFVMGNASIYIGMCQKKNLQTLKCRIK